MRESLKAYKKVSVDNQLTDASPHKVIQMLLAGAIERLIQGKLALQQGDIPLKTERFSKALDIVLSLKNSLSMDENIEIADNLDALYQYMIQQITLANRENNAEPADEVIYLLREIKSAWDQIPSEFHYIDESTT